MPGDNMRVVLGTIWLAAAVLVASAALAASPSDYSECEQGADQERRIAGCTRVIQDQSESADNRATAYSNRGVAYKSKGDYDRAVADYSDAIRLKPKNTDAYVNRGLAHVAKRQLDRAIADY